jgi:hypothetical protein
VKFAFIEAEKANFPIAALCRILQVSRQGYYCYAKRPDSARVRSDAALQQAVRSVHDESEQRYGRQPARPARFAARWGTRGQAPGGTSDARHGPSRTRFVRGRRQTPPSTDRQMCQIAPHVRAIQKH